MPPGFDLPFASEVWLPLQLSLQSLPPARMAARSYDLIARLRPGASVEQADAESKSIARQLEQEHPQSQRGWGFRFISIGFAISLIGAVVLSRYLARALYGVGATDPLTFSLIVALLIATALAACLLPALKATRTDPLVALRSE